ncbi:GNAT family N-acetyltransferase [Cohnella nanjingensis]|uniref:GNAT family N-acetyltransferase n=1 Tax=Cohnella nanjingensis TaxID=1387779 RepID=A0A7X0VDV7_9BACL|nr:GNAT family N-acetyltransferase [Cohnella nanjingensis]MBB6670357.1 GNAT family N-acetyltransferase [Cohnella nanjingensis]
MEFKSLRDYTLDQLAVMWNEGFTGYFVDATQSPEGFLRRFAAEHLSLDLSFAAVLEGKPVGFVLSGARAIGGTKTAWNGGTGIAPAYRGQGIGKLMIAEALRRYAAHGVGLATLEAIAANAPAIALYERMGYRTINRLKILQQTGELPAVTFAAAGTGPFRVQLGTAPDVRGLSFYDHSAPWQTQWANLTNAESAILYDDQDRPLGYALFKLAYDEHGNPASASLFQCRADERREDAGAIVRHLLAAVFPPHPSLTRRTMNLPASHAEAVQALEQAGFSLLMEQVQMTQPLSPEEQA